MRITPFEMLIYMTIGYPTNEISLCSQNYKKVQKPVMDTTMA